MLTYFIYCVVFFILLFVLIIAVKAITRGIEAKENNKLDLINEKKSDKEILDLNLNHSNDLINKIKDLNELYDKGILNEDEFKKAKDKILK